MSFFDFSPGNETEPDRWTVSGKLYIYWVVAIPLTAVTMLTWFGWRHSRDATKSWSKEAKHLMLKTNQRFKGSIDTEKLVA